MGRRLKTCALLSLGFVTTPAFADTPTPARVNEICSQVPCDSGLTCVQTKDGRKMCSTCDQSKLGSYTRAVEDSCKAFGTAWTPDNSPEYNAARADDSRVLVDVYDTMLASAKQCKEARVSRERECWAGGDDQHRQAIDQVSTSIDRISDHKSRQISDRRVYYGSTSDYRGYLGTFSSKCTRDVNFPDLNQKIDVMSSEQGRGNKINCSDLERYGNDSERCFNSAKDLKRYGFADSSSKFPDDYARSYDTAEKTMNKARDLLKTVKDKSLCQ